MKKLTILAVAVLAFAATSCKKAYTCSCTTTFNYSGFSPDTYKDDSEEYSKKMTKKTAEAACDNKADSFDNSYKNALTDNGTDTNPGVTAKTECELKD